MASKPTDTEMRLLMLGAALVRHSPESAKIIASALVAMEDARIGKKPKRRKKR